MYLFGALVVLALGAVTPALATIASPIPEPSTMVLVGGGLAAAILIARKRKQKSDH